MNQSSGALRRRMRGLAVLVAVIGTLVAACSSGGNTSGNTSSGGLTLGFIASQTGAAASQSVTIINGAELAVAEYNKSHKRQVKLDIQDDQSNPAKGLAAYNVLASAGIKAIVGPAPSSVALAVKPVANRQHVLLMSSGTSSSAYPTEGGYTFRTWVALDVLERATAHYFATKLGIKSVAILAEDSQTYRAAAAADQQVFPADGGKVTAQEFVDPTQADYLPQLTKLIATHPGTLMIEFTSPASIGNAVKQARQLGFKGPIMTSNNAGNNAFLNAAGPAANDVYWSVPSTANSATYTTFEKAYQAKYGQAPDALAASAFDDVMIMAEALAASGNNGPAIRDYLLKLKDYDGASGPVTFKSNGDLVSKPVLTKMVKGGQIVDVLTSQSS